MCVYTATSLALLMSLGTLMWTNFSYIILFLPLRASFRFDCFVNAYSFVFRGRSTWRKGGYVKR